MHGYIIIVTRINSDCHYNQLRVFFRLLTMSFWQGIEYGSHYWLMTLLVSALWLLPKYANAESDTRLSVEVNRSTNLHSEGAWTKRQPRHIENIVVASLDVRVKGLSVPTPAIVTCTPTVTFLRNA